ncbi:MAG TPA: molybdopterin-binding protein [Candidatus Binatus sp.]|nr:molybdopterin-binding protein [Candidatus Binatus sp.]
MSTVSKKYSRRNLLVGAVQASGFLLLTGCEKIFDSLSRSETFNSILESAEGGNRRIQRLFAGRSKLAQEFSEKDISPKFRSNGNPPPITIDYAEDAAKQFSKWRLEISGLVKQPGSFSLADLKSMPARTQITRHDCVEGWSVIGKWKGVRLEEIIKRVQPSAEAKYVVFRCMDTDSDGTTYYESIDLVDAVHPQTILAYELNGQPLPVANGAPLRLRIENQLGYKHAKYIRSLEFVASLEKIGSGKGGYWEDQGYEWYAGI